MSRFPWRRRWLTWLVANRAALLAGLIATLSMVALLLILRERQGIASPIDLGLERLAPHIPVPIFLTLLWVVGGYNNLKLLGVFQIVLGLLVVGAWGGALYAWLRRRRSGLVASGLMLGVVAVAWLALISILWPVLGTHYAGLPPSQARGLTALVLFLGHVVYAVVLLALYPALVTPPANRRGEVTSPLPPTRRAFLAYGLGLVVALVAGDFLRRLLQRGTFSYDGIGYSGPDVQPITPTDRFYSVTKNVIDPRVDRRLWRLEVDGLVRTPRVYTYDEIAALPPTTQATTLMCISNAVGGGLMSNAVWQGVPLRTILDAAGPLDNIREVVLQATDGYTDTIPFAKAMEPTTLLAYTINGEPLPHIHGYPVRVIVPGLFGEKNVKWITRLELVDYDVKGFYETQGWGPNFVIPTHSRFDAPDFSQPVRVGTTITLKGTAFAGDRGVTQVEVSLDAGQTWQSARIDYAGTRLTWVQWSLPWQPTQTGEYTLVVRATDGTGAVQTAEMRHFAPQGALGQHRVTAHVVA